MLYFLIAMTSGLLLLFYLINGKELISATLFVLVEYLATFIFSLFARSQYGINDISGYMVFVVLMSFVFMGFGELLSKALSSEHKPLTYNKDFTASTKNRICLKEYVINTKTIFLFFVLSLIVAYWALRDLLSFASRNGISGDFITTFTLVRSLTAKGIITYTKSSFLSQATTICAAASYVCIYIFFYNWILCNKKKIVYLMPVIGEMLILVSTTGRVAFIRLFTIIFSIGIVFIKTKTNWSKEKDRKIVKYVIVTFVLFLVLFRILGYLTSKSDRSDVLENFYGYIAAGVFGFDKALNSPEIVEQSVWGHHAFYNLYVILNSLGFRISLGSQFNESIDIGSEGLGTVMGTGLLVPTQDFGVIGMLFTRFMIGFIYQWVFMRIKGNPNCINRPIQMIFLGIIMYPIIMSSLDDAFRTIFSIGYIYLAFYLYLFIRLFVEKQDSLPLDSDDYSAAIATKSIGRQETVS